MKPNCASIRAAAPTASWSDWQKLDQASLRQYQAGDISGYRADTLGDGRHGEKPRTRSATGIAPRQPQAGARHRVRIRPPARPRTRLQPRHRPRQRHGASKFDPSYFPPTLTPQYGDVKNALARLQLPVLSGLRSRQKQPAGGSAAMREPDRIIRLKTVLARTGLSRSTIYRKIAEGTFPPSSKSAPTGPAGMNPTSTAGSPIPSHGVRKASSMKSGEPCVLSFCRQQWAGPAADRKGWRYRAPASRHLSGDSHHHHSLLGAGPITASSCRSLLQLSNSSRHRRLDSVYRIIPKLAFFRGW